MEAVFFIFIFNPPHLPLLHHIPQEPVYNDAFEFLEARDPNWRRHVVSATEYMNAPKKMLAAGLAV